MSNEKTNLVKSRIEEQISKIENNDFTLYFYVIDTKGVPSGSLSYIYDIALSLKDMGYKIGMLHGEDEFVGVEEWLGKEYSELPHYNIMKNSIEITPSDFLFIPEIYSNVMEATRKLPCQRIAIMQSFDKLTEFIPFGASWGDLGIYKAITTNEDNSKRLKSYFPNLDIDIIRPKISKVFKKSNELKKLIVNLVTREPSDINKIVKTFFWQYPMYRWIAFRDLRGLSREEFSNALQEGAITVWVDDNTNFGYVPLEAMKCGSIVIGKVPEIAPEWMITDKEDGINLSNAGIWVDNMATLPSVLASVIRTWTMDEIPTDIQKSADELVSEFNDKNQLNDIKNVIIKLINDRKNSFLTTLESLNDNKE